MGNLTHIDDTGAARMVDVTEKDSSRREAIAECFVHMRAATLAEIVAGALPKGDVLAVARIAGIQAAKRCSDLIPLCHPLPLTGVTVQLVPDGDTRLRIEARCKVTGRTGVEMEALTAASVAGLTVYDMCKAIDREMTITDLALVSKTGGKSGDWQRTQAP